MKFVLTLLTVLSSCLANSQNQELKVVYNYTNHAKPNTYMMELLANDQEVLSYTIRLTKSGAGKNISYKQTTDSTLLYQNHQQGYFVYEEKLGREHLVMQEKLDLFDWRLTGEKDTIVNYPCKSAIAEFRGREYMAYYTTDLPFTAAPWKFHGLPGVMLKLVSTDDVLVFQSEAIKLGDESGIIRHPFEHKTAIEYDEFCKKYKAYRKEVIKKRKQRAKQQNRPAPKNDKAPRIEVIIPENRFILND
ncbi:GLPGLI family protein [Carboxylicivirga sp. M1479]|uniref:GLPGLI family protein n=1 Tax=Carboxylicivirga sp. M1479 TaxID=2594476 RepID=UPI00117792B4|nr:GLPGLI family protein [Carboxylicivirga sp. M1479]TRX71397.1 GLPGLI family protein [Carboxylicivirga sp. M1479]